MWMITRITHILTSFIFPSYCYLCKQEGKALCDTCLSQRTRSYDTPSPYITAIYSFKDPAIKKIIHAIKYFHRKDLIKPLAVRIAKEMTTQNRESYLILPIPMPTLRKYIRGYNHTEELAYCLSQETGIASRTDILIRNKNSRRQVTTKAHSERLKNQHNAFSVLTPLHNTHIILIDDVTTTGATLHEARKVLLAQGASTVEAYTVAH